MKRAPKPIKNPLEMALLARVEAYLAASGMTPSAFGIAICRDAKLLPSIRGGREIKLSLAADIEAEMKAGWDRLAAAVEQQRKVS